MIELKSVYHTYWNSNFGLIGGNLKIESGKIVGILGANGSGKTTLLKTIAGISEILHGEILIDGLPVTEQYENIAFITEEGSYLPHLTPEEYGLFLADFFARFQMERYRKLLEFFEIPDDKIRTFSRGQKSKVEIAAGFAKGVKYIFMDEPFLGKDVFARRDFLKLMITSLRSDETVLITTHFIDEIVNVIDRALILKKGRVAADVSIDELREEGKDLTMVMSEIAGYEEEQYKEIFE